MICSNCKNEDVETAIEPWSGLGIETLRKIVKCNHCENWEIIKETAINNEKLIWFEKERNEN